MRNDVTTQERRKARVRSNLSGTSKMPRLSVHRTGKHLYAQLIDDEKQVTIVGVSEKLLEKATGTKTEKAKALGVLIAKKAIDAKIKKAVFDRGAYRYHGRVKAFADGAREGGLVF